MDDKNAALFKMLVEQTRVLVVVCDNAAEVLSEDFKSMVQGPLETVKYLLEQCPDADIWDGSYRETDAIVEVYRHESHREGPDRAVKITHLPTGMSVESYSKDSREANEQVASRALADRVQRAGERQQRLSEANSRK